MEEYVMVTSVHERRYADLNNDPYIGKPLPPEMVELDNFAKKELSQGDLWRLRVSYYRRLKYEGETFSAERKLKEFLFEHELKLPDYMGL